MKLTRLAEHKNIVIQCHNIPDADSICSGFALQCFLQSLGAQVSLIYGGPAAITKPSLVMLTDMLKISIEKVDALPPDTDLLITVDCQCGAGNVQGFDLPNHAGVIVIDHHRPEIQEGEHTCIRPNLASCATVVWDLLNKEGFEMDSRVQNALFYGLYTDTNGLTELRHPLDRDLAEVPGDSGMIKKLKNAAITLDELDIISDALGEYEIYQNIGLFRAEPCDPNLLGFTSDIAQQVAHMDCCVVYCEMKHGLKLSIRSSAREIMASEIAAFLCRDAGSGGGGLEKAGGFLSLAKITEISGNANPSEYLRSRLIAYLDNYDYIYAGENDEDFGAMPLFKKLPVPVGFISSADVFPDGTKVTVRTLEGDIDMVTGSNIILMVGILGEVYPINRERFETGYEILGKPYEDTNEYQPTLTDRITGEKRVLKPVSCIPKGDKCIRARPLKRETKVFTHWDTEKYFYGAIGDYLAAGESSYDDCYIIRQDIFMKTYEPVS